MKFTETKLTGVWLIEIEPCADVRGFFARTWDCDAFAARGLNPNVLQCSISYNRKRGTLRGMHYQAAPHEETKLVRCTRGAIYDVVVDLRSDSPTYRQWIAFELNMENHRMLYIPPGCAHGFQTLTDEAEVFYQIADPYQPESARGLRYDDPALAIEWPLPVSVISQKDCNWPFIALSKTPT